VLLGRLSLSNQDVVTAA